MTAAVLPLAWVPAIGGLVCDYVVEHASGQRSAWPSAAEDFGICRFEDGTWMVQLPMGIGHGRTLPAAQRAARRDQHDALRRERELAIEDATVAHIEARARRLGAVTLAGSAGDLVLLNDTDALDALIGGAR